MREEQTICGFLLLGLYLSGTLGFFLLAWFQNLLTLHWVVLVAGLVVGFGSTIGNLLFMKALAYGPVVSPIFALNSLVVARLSIVWFKERLSRLQTVALIGTFLGIMLLRI